MKKLLETLTQNFVEGMEPLFLFLLFLIVFHIYQNQRLISGLLEICRNLTKPRIKTRARDREKVKIKSKKSHKRE